MTDNSSDQPRQFVRVTLADGRGGWVDPVDQPPFDPEQRIFCILTDDGVAENIRREDIVGARIVRGA